MCIRDRWYTEPPTIWWKIDLQKLVDLSNGRPILRHKNGIISYYGVVPAEAIVGQHRHSTVADDFETVWLNPAYQ
eukprot:6426369-Alexandrium_andersonii.AAC.1